MLSVIISEKQIKPLSTSPKHRGGQYIFLFHSRWYSKNLTDLQQILEIKGTSYWLKYQNPKNLRIKYQERVANLKCSINKKALLHRRLFSATLPTKILLLLESIFTNKIDLIILFQ